MPSGAHIGRCADRRPRHREPLLIGDLRDPEVRHHRPALHVEHDIGRLDVAVNDAAAVRVAECRAHLLHDGLHHRDRERADFADDAVERPALDELHHEVQRLPGFLDRVDRDDVRVAQRSRRARLTLEALGHSFAAEQVGAHHLDGDLTIERDVVGEVHRRHPALAEQPHHLEFAKGCLAQRFKDGGVARREAWGFELGGGDTPLLAGDVRAAAGAEPRARQDRLATAWAVGGLGRHRRRNIPPGKRLRRNAGHGGDPFPDTLRPPLRPHSAAPAAPSRAGSPCPPGSSGPPPHPNPQKPEWSPSCPRRK